MLTIIWVFSKWYSFGWWRVLPGCCWLLTYQVGGGWRLGWVWQVLKIRQQWSLMDSSFYRRFLCSRQCCLTAFYPQNSFPNWSQSSQALPLLYQLSLWNILNPLLSFQQSSRHLHQQRLHLRKSLCSSMRSTSTSITVLSWDGSNSVPSSGSTSNSSSLAVSTTSAVTSSTEVLNPSKSSMRVGINFFQTPINVAIWTSSHESRMFLIVNPFQKAFNLFCPDPSEELLSMAAVALQMYVLHNYTCKLKLLLGPWAAEWTLC